MQVELIERGLQAELEFPIQVRFKGVIVGEYAADLFVARKVMVELKVAKVYDPRDEAQLLNQLKATGVEVDLLINFCRDKVEFKRMVGGVPSVQISVYPWQERTIRSNQPMQLTGQASN